MGGGRECRGEEGEEKEEEHVSFAALVRGLEGTDGLRSLWSMQDDWSLRMWCETAREKAAQLDDDGDLGDGGLTDEIRPWEVSDEVKSSAYRPRKRKSLHSSSFSDDPDDSDRSTHSTADDFFHPTDLLDEQLLPARLPKSLIKRSPVPKLGKDMEHFQRRIHEKLNVVAGLQVRMAALQEVRRPLSFLELSR